MLILPYTLCFCLCGDQVLMLYRRKTPNAGRWNGLGGKIEDGETPLASLHREMMEEADIDLYSAQEVSFAGLVTWTFQGHTEHAGGMYTFLAYLPPDFPRGSDRLTPEGLLSWKTVDWVCNPRSKAVVSNIPCFLPLMLAKPGPYEYCCTYRRGKLQTVVMRRLPDDFSDPSGAIAR